MKEKMCVERVILMKRKKVKMFLILVVCILLICPLIMVGYLLYNDYGITVGRLLIEGNDYMVIDGKTPIILSDQNEKKNVFAGLSTGDKILAVHGGVDESLPARTGAYHIFRIAKGDESDIPDDVIITVVEKDYEYEADEIKDNMKEYDFEAQYIRTNGGKDGIEYPIVKVIRSVEELNAYYEENKDYFDLERKEKVYSDTTIGFLDACDEYDTAYFKKQMLVFVLLEEGSGSIRHHVENVGITAENKLVVFIETETPEVGTCDIAQWHIMIELEQGVDITNESDITVFLDYSVPLRSMLYDVGTYEKQAAKIR